MELNLERLKQKDLAELLGIDERSIRKIAPEGLPSHGTGKDLFYSWAEVRTWWIDRQVRVTLIGRAGATTTKEELKERAALEQRKLVAETEFAEMKTAKAAGLLVDAEEAEKTWADFLSGLKTNLLSFPDRVAPKLDGSMSLAETVAVLQEEIAKSLRDIVLAEGGDGAAA